MRFIPKFLLAYFGAIVGTVGIFLLLLAAFLGLFGLFLFGDNAVSRMFMRVRPDIFLSLLYGVTLILMAWWLGRRKAWQRKELALLLAVSLVTWGVVFAAYRFKESERIELYQGQQQQQTELAAQAMRISGADTRFVGLDTNAPRYEGIVRVSDGIPGSYEYTITIDAGGIKRTIGPQSIHLDSEHEGPALPPFSIAVDEVAREWARKNMSTTAVQTGFDLSFNVAATLRLVEDAQGLLVNGAPEDVNSLLARDTLFVWWDHGAMQFSARQKAAVEGDACSSFFDCQKIACPNHDDRGCGYSKSCQQGTCVCQLVCS